VEERPLKLFLHMCSTWKDVVKFCLHLCADKSWHLVVSISHVGIVVIDS